MNLEYSEKAAIWNRDRAGRGAVGRSDLRDLGFSAQESLSGAGAITTNNAAGSAVNGNVRNPDTLDYYNRGNLAGAGFTRTFPGAACGNFTTHPQGDPGGGCLTDAAQQYSQIQPKQKNINFFGRAAWQLTPALQTYAELNVYHSESHSATTPSTVSGSVGYPGGPVSNAGVSLGAAHPDNPYFGTAARLRYLAADVGPRLSEVNSTFTRFVAGIKGTVAGWDIDSAMLYSQNKVSNDLDGYLQRDVAFALLNPTAANVAAASLNPAYAALPAGSLWRIAENAGLNSPELYAALSPRISNDAKTHIAQIDFKASREVAKLDGGGLGVAVGAEFRHESTRTQAHHRHGAGQYHRPRLFRLQGQPQCLGHLRRGAGARAENRGTVGRPARRPFHRRGQFLHAKSGREMDARARTGPARHLRQGLPRPQRGGKRRRWPGRVLHRQRSAALRAGRGSGMRSGVDRRHHLAQSEPVAGTFAQLFRRRRVGPAAAQQHFRRPVANPPQE